MFLILHVYMTNLCHKYTLIINKVITQALYYRIRSKRYPLISIIEQSEHLFTTLSKNALFKPIFSITSYAQKVFKCSKKNIYIYSTSP